MTAVHRLADFQRAAVDHIVTRLRDRRGSRRFLLADEVGLGKTIVARGVIDELAKRKRSSLTVVYLCSNTEIAEQNKKKLVEGGGQAVGRATELVTMRPAKTQDVDMYAFTPGTSLRRGTGTSWERRLMLYLLNRVAGIDVSTRQWREFFCCGASPDRWQAKARWAQLREDFAGATRTSCHADLKEALRVATYDGQSFLAMLNLHVERFSSGNAEKRRHRTQLIRQYRGILQRVALRGLQPDLLVLDEVQRFKEVIDKADDEKTIAYELFHARAPVLILSATPYRLFTAEFEAKLNGEDHHRDFYRTLEFLYDRNKKAPTRVRKNLEAFGERLRRIALDTTRDEGLLELKRKVEGDLRQVICRTERNWFFLDARRGVREQGVDRHELPGRAELREFMDIHQGLASHLGGAGLVTDFWKSAPSVLTFMDKSYAFTKKLREQKVRVPRGLLERANHTELPARNLRVRRLVQHALGDDGRAPLLWTRPTYTYHQDSVYGDRSPRKMLVFSGWRFVPKAVAVLLSDAAATRVGKRGGDRSQPLRFTSRGSLHVFDSCMPSWALAETVGVEVFAPRENGTLPDAREVLARARRQIEQRLSELEIEVGPTRAEPSWRAIAYLERFSSAGEIVKEAMEEWKQSAARSHRRRRAGINDQGASESEYRAVRQLRDWVHFPIPDLRIGQADLDRLALIAVASPATCLLRALIGTYGADALEDPEVLTALYELCLGELRAYFNRPLVQQIVRKHKPTFKWEQSRRRRGAKRSYSAALVGYALDHHMQAVLDEHVYLLRHASSRSTAPEAIEHFTSVWSLGRGARRTNRAHGRGDRVMIGADADNWPTDFALAFGDEVAASDQEGNEEDRRMRRSDVREAFNSPFWPFVLATTSVGQEGLDFHLHCRDIFHWNLPSNPVDLEQREGRINRRDCLAVRQSIARDHPLPEVVRLRNGSGANPWAALFAHLDSDSTGGKRKHGLHPHWIYECRDREHTVPIERHVAFFQASRDSRKYDRLKTGLALYRLVFGQVNQEHLLNDLEKRLAEVPEGKRDEVKRHLSGYMLNLSPIDSAVALKFANEEARELVAERYGSGVRQLLEDVDHIVQNHADELATASPMIRELQDELRRTLERQALGTHRVSQVATALAYLRNPYDQYFDGQSVGGFDDDVAVIRRALRMSGPRKLGSRRRSK